MDNDKKAKRFMVTPEALQKQLDRQCIPTPIDPEYVANMITFLSSQDAQNVHSWKFHGRRWFHLVIQEAWSLVINLTMVQPEVF